MGHMIFHFIVNIAQLFLDTKVGVGFKLKSKLFFFMQHHMLFKKK